MSYYVHHFVNKPYPLCPLTFYTINDLQDVPPKNEPQILTNGGTSLNSNVVHILDSDDENEEWICIKNDCLYHVHQEDKLESKKIVADEVVDSHANEKSICCNKECVFHKNK